MMEQMGGAGGMPDMSQFGAGEDELDEVDDVTPDKSAKDADAAVSHSAGTADRQVEDVE